MNLENLLDAEYLNALAHDLLTGLIAYLASGELVAQVGVVLVAASGMLLLRKWLEHLLDLAFWGRFPWLARLPPLLRPLVVPLAFLFLLLIGESALEVAGLRSGLPGVLATLTAVWIVVRLSARLLGDNPLSRVIASIAWIVAALNITGLLHPTLEVLDRLAVSVGDVRLSLLLVIKAVAMLGLLLWGAGVIGRMVEHRLSVASSMTPSMRVLLSKLTRFGLIIVAVAAGLNMVGIDLTAFAVFSGAIGVGVGFGLQKVVSNLVSGLILLMDKSIKPGDVIAIGETYGWITALNARFVSVVTRDGVEHLIPNEDLITGRVENWSFTDSLVRLKIPVGVAYNTDVRQAIALCIEAAAKTRRVVSQPPPNCLLRGFGDSSVDLEIRFWITDPSGGVSNVRSDVLLNVWDAFRENGIEIPFPQRDIHVKSWTPATAETLQEEHHGD